MRFAHECFDLKFMLMLSVCEQLSADSMVSLPVRATQTGSLKSDLRVACIHFSPFLSKRPTHCHDVNRVLMSGGVHINDEKDYADWKVSRLSSHHSEQKISCSWLVVVRQDLAL